MLPLLTLNQYLTTFVSRDLQRSVDGRILKVRVLTDLRLFNEAFITLQRLLHGERLPQIGDSHFRQTESKMSSLKFNTSKPITEPVNLRVSPSYLTCFLSLCLSLSISVSFDSGYSVYPFVLSLGLSVCLYVCVCFHLSFISLCLAIFYHYGCVSVCSSICLFSVSICLSVSFISMVVCLSTSLSFIYVTLSFCAFYLYVCLSAGSGDGPGQAPVLQPGHPVWAPHDLSPVPGTGAPVCVPGRHHPCHPQNGGRHVSQCTGLN